MNRHGPLLKKLSESKQRRLDFLLNKNNEGALTTRERVVLEGLVRDAEKLMVHNAKRLAKFVGRDQSPTPADAVPVTVWVSPTSVSRTG